MAWTPEITKPLCRHNWVRQSTTDHPDGERVYVHQCPKCGKVKETHRIILPWRKVKPPAAPKCHHIWMGVSVEEGSGADAGLRRYTHRCPRCDKVKTTIRRIQPKVAK